MLYSKKLIDYITDMEVAACIIEHEWKILLVQRCVWHKHGGTWTEPGWKVEAGESHERAMIREIYEESGVIIKAWEADLLFKKYFRFDDTNIAITFYHIILDIKPEVTLSAREHSDYVWVTPKEALTMNLIEDFDTIIRWIFFSSIPYSINFHL